MIDSRIAPYAAFVLRIALGAMFVAHSLILRHFIFSLPGTARFFESIGLPAALAYFTESVRARWRSRWCPSSSAPLGCTPATAGSSAHRTAAGSTPCS
jgi:uncharacterized membrane protein YphA (DoxX/SURF4 family)